MADVTQILNAIEAGDPKAAADLLPLVYEELRKLAAARLAEEKPGQTLQATALVHEAYLRLVGGQSPQDWNGRGHFFAAAAEAMRRILVEAARRKGRARHGGDQRRVELDATAEVVPDDNLLAVNEALDHLATVNPEAAAVVKLRFFAGLTGREAAEATGVSPRKADQLWAYARAWLLDRLSPVDLGIPLVSISDAVIVEGSGGTTDAVFTVTISAASTRTVSVAYDTANGSSLSGVDYGAGSGTVTFAPGQTSASVTVPVNGDRLGEQNETFFVNLSGATNATVVDGQAVGTVLDDEPRISISDVSQYEGQQGQTTLFVFTVTLSAAYDQPVTMSYQTKNGTAKTSNNDHVAKSGTLTFAPGETTKTITIEVKGDSKRETNEYFYLDLFGNSNSLFTKSRGIGTILNDD